MPNHVTNEIFFPSTVNLEPYLSENDDGEIYFDFDKIIPYPQKFAELDKAADDYDQKHGAFTVGRPRDGFNQGGYEWCIENWGTKWNSYSNDFSPDGKIYFKTAWSPPLPVIEELSYLLDCEIVLRYADEDIGANTGVYVFKSGEAVDVIIHENLSLEAYKLALEFHDYANEWYKLSDCGTYYKSVDEEE